MKHEPWDADAFRMRILALTNLYPNPQQPNRATYNRQQFRALAAEHEVRVIAPVAWTDEWAARRQGKPPLPRDRKVVCDGIPVEHPRYWYVPGVLRGTQGRFFLWSVRPAFERAVAEFRPEVVLASWAYPDGWAAVELGRRFGLPVVIKVHGSDVLLARGARQRRVGEALRRADGVIAVSRDLARHVIGMGVDAGKVRVVYNGVDTDRFCPGDRAAARERLGLASETPLLLFVGNLVPVKGLDVLIAALGRLAREGLGFRCCLIGQGPLRGALERQAIKEGIGEWVRFVGPVAHDQLPDWFRAADLFVLPSRSEGVPNVLLEASACGTPYVASRVGGIPEIAELGNGWLVQAGDVGELTRAMGERLRFGPNNRDSVPRGRRSFADGAREIAQLLAGAMAVFHRAGQQEGSEHRPVVSAVR